MNKKQYSIITILLFAEQAVSFAERDVFKTNIMITSRQNSLIKAFRKSDDLIVVEGVKLVTEALNAGFVPQVTLITEKASKKYPNISGDVITDDLAEYISDTKTPQGVFVKFERKDNPLTGNSPLMILDGVRDPGNVGAIIRSCEAFGFGGIVLSNDSADMYNPKVIRASAGSAFRLPNIRGELSEIIPQLKQSGFKVWVAALDENAVSLKEVADKISKTKPSMTAAIVIGSEGQGVSDEILAMCDYKLYIPIKGAESLNAGVAAGIICYELGRYIEKL